MQPLTIEPARSLGPFVLGSSINDVIAIVKRDAVVMRDVHVVFDQADPLAHDTVIDIVDLSIRLRFSSHTQRLLLIDCYAPASLSFRYLHSSFPSAPSRLSLSSIYAVFGPTYPPQWEQAKQAYLLQYPGVCFAFRNGNTDGLAPIETDFDMMDDGHTQLARIFVHYGQQADTSPPAALVTATVDSASAVQLHVGRGVWLSSRQLWLTFDSSVQDVLVGLGPPDAITPKQDEKMRIHAATAQQQQQQQQQQQATAVSSDAGADYFYNYYQLGLDLLLDGRRGVVKKIVLHTNCLGGREFGQYNKCDFLLLLPAAPALAPSASAVGDEVAVPMVAVGCNARWDEVAAVLRDGGCEVSRGMLNGGADKGSNPFGSTMFFASRGVLFEVMRHGMVQSVTLFNVHDVR